MLIKAALNGNRPPGAHSDLPVSPSELAEAASDSVAAGAGAVHLHPRNSAGSESLSPEDVARSVEAVRTAVPRTPVGVTTGAWIAPSAAERRALVAAWAVLPEFASVNFHEEGAADLALLLEGMGVGVEAGLCDAAAASRLVESGLAPRALRVLIEPQERELPAAMRTVEEIEAVLDAAAVAAPRLLHGTEATVWGLIAEAARRGYDTRIGLEDTLVREDGTEAAGNAALVVEARRLYARAR
jgi:uncharacterized protein (DUF849 family)